MAVNPSRRPNLAVLADWLEGRLGEEQAAEVADAVEHDSGLADDVAWIRGLVRAREQLPLVDPPALLRQRLEQEFRRRNGASPAPGPDAPGAVTPPLVFDSRRDQLALALRAAGEADGDVVDLVWRSDDVEVVVRARSTSNDRVRLSGQVLTDLAADAPVFEAHASGPAGEVRSVDGDEHGRFRIDVRRDSERLRLSNGELSVEVPLDLHERGDE